MELGLIVLLCYLTAGSPPPSVNEPHYLGKAKHYWSPEWCKGDFFFESADAHLVFFWTFGWVTKFFSLTTSAWIGRIAVWTLFAASWRSLVRTVTGVPWGSFLSTAILLPTIQFAHLSGEWLIGGIEAKGFAYAFVFWGIAKAVEKKWNSVWPLLGIASSFHILVGGWAVIACLIAWCLHRKSDELSILQLAVWLVLGGCCALPGLIPAIQLTAQATTEELREASVTYTFRRLSHHLVFHRFHLTRWCYFGVLIIAWWFATKWSPAIQQLQRLKSIVIGSLVIAAGGIAVDYLLRPMPNAAPELIAKFEGLRANLLRYYWFRLSDVLVPAGFSIALVASLKHGVPASDSTTPRDSAASDDSVSSGDTRPSKLRYAFPIALLFAAIGIGMAMGSHGVRARSLSLQQQNWRVFPPEISDEQVDADWLDVCVWIRDAQNTPTTSLFLTPTRQQTFKWSAHRPDVVTWKDVPQDAGSLIEWWKRRKEVYLLGEWPWLYPENLANIISQYGVTHVVWPDLADHTVPANIKQVYRNELFRVFELPRDDDMQSVPSPQD